LFFLLIEYLLIMDNKIKNILSLYQQLSENKKIISELTVSPSSVNYSTMKFAPRTKSDQINKALLDDIDTAAKAAGVDVTIDFAKTGHNKLAKSGNVSRHWTNNAVDIDYIGGKVVSPENREIVDKFVNALISMGYTKNAEGESNPKSVLTFGFPAHDNHVHVSNTTDNTSQIGSDYDSEETSTEKSTGDTKTRTVGDDILGDFIDKLGAVVGLKEGKIYGSFGKGIKDYGGAYLISKDQNPTIYSPVSGKINNIRIKSGCKNQVTIYHQINGKDLYLEFCGISKLSVSDGDSVSKGTVLGKTSDDVIATLYNKNRDRVSIKSYSDSKESKTNDNKTNKSSGNLKYIPKKEVTSYRSKTGYQDPVVDLLGSILTYPARYLERKKRKDLEKIEENIEKIKKLLK